MNKCRWLPRVEAWFDGESRDAEAVSAHVRGCSACSAFLAHVEGIRAVLRGREQPSISDAQLGAFTAGIRGELLAQPARWRGVWPVFSLAAAALLIALATFAAFTGPGPVDATQVESVSTELEGARVDVYSSEDVTTLWITNTKDDL